MQFPVYYLCQAFSRLWQFWEKNIVRKVDFIEKNQLFSTSLPLYTSICGIIYMRWQKMIVQVYTNRGNKYVRVVHSYRDPETNKPKMKD